MSNLDFLTTGIGSDVDAQKLDRLGFRRVQHMNETPLHSKTAIRLGGYAIADEDSTAPAIGDREKIDHQGGKSTLMRTAKVIEVAIVGFSPRYYIATYPDPVDALKTVTLTSDSYIAPEQMPTAGGKCRQAVDLFVALRKQDGKRELWQLLFRGHVVSGATNVIAQVRGMASNAAADIFARTKTKVTVHPFAFWVSLGVAEGRLVGKAEKSPVNDPVIVGEPAPVTADEYAAFVELRKELDEWLKSQPYARTTPALAPAAPARASLPGPERAAALGELVAADGEVRF